MLGVIDNKISEIATGSVKKVSDGETVWPPSGAEAWMSRPAENLNGSGLVTFSLTIDVGAHRVLCSEFLALF
jgi:hypothetical protein